LNHVKEAQEEKLFYDFWRLHKMDLLSVCDANRSLIENYLNENGLAPSPRTLEEAYSALSRSLARNAEPMPVPKPESPVEAEPPEEVDEQKRLRAMTKEQLREVVRGQRKYQTPDGAPVLAPLPARYDALAIRALPAKELSKLIQRYGGSVVTARLQGN
jgi:hypothetical protein